MRNINKNFLSFKNETIKDALKKIIKNGTRTVLVLDQKKKLLGTLSEGDVQKFLIKNKDINSKIDNIFNRFPEKVDSKKIDKDKLREKFISKQLGLLPVVNNNNIVEKILTWSEIFEDRKIKSSLKSIDVIIMAGGKGERLKPYTDILPKPLVPINSKPMLEHIIDNLKYFNFRKFHLILNHQANLIKTYFKSKNNKFYINFVKEKKPLGTIGGLSLIKKINSENILISNCDTLFKIDYSDFFNFHKKGNYFLSMIVSKTNYVFPYGACKVKSKRLIALQEKPSSIFIANTGLYFAKKEIVKYIPRNKFYNMNTLIEKCLKLKKKVGVFNILQNSWTDLGQLSDLQKYKDKI